MSSLLDSCVDRSPYRDSAGDRWSASGPVCSGPLRSPLRAAACTRAAPWARHGSR